MSRASAQGFEENVSFSVLTSSGSKCKEQNTSGPMYKHHQRTEQEKTRQGAKCETQSLQKKENIGHVSYLSSNDISIEFKKKKKENLCLKDI